MVSDKIRYEPKWTIYKYKDPDNKVAKYLGAGGDVYRAPNAPYAVEEFPGNVALKTGIKNLIIVSATPSGYTRTLRWSNSKAYLMVGSTSTAASAGQTALLASKTASYSKAAAMDANYPTRTSTTCKWRSTYSGTVANFNWYEYTVRNTNTKTSGASLNRKISTKGTKASGETWTLELQITYS